MRERGWFGFLKVRIEGDGLVSDFASVQKLLDCLLYEYSGSEKSIGTYTHHLAMFCRWVKVPPNELLSRDRAELERLVNDYLDDVCKQSKKRGNSMRYVNLAKACLKTFFRGNGFNKENNLELRLKRYRQPPRTRNRTEYVPKIGEAYRMAERAKGRRNRAVLYTLNSTGLRNSGLRALIVGDIRRELEEDRENLLIKVEPEWNKRLPGACKNGIRYYTFTSHQAKQAIREMLEERKEKFGAIADHEPLFLSKSSQFKRKNPLSDRELQQIVKNAAKEANIEKWMHVTPHSLRKVFEGVLRSPLRNGGRMDGKDQEFLMGHILPGVQEHYYDWKDIDKLRSEFSQLMFEDKEPPELEDLKMYRKMAKILGINPSDIKKESEQELGRVINLEEEKKVLEQQIQSSLRHFKEDFKEQKVVPKEELQAYLQNRWRFLGTIDPQHVVVEKVSAEPVGTNSIVHIQTGDQEVFGENAAKPPITLDKARTSSNGSIQKEKTHDSKLHVREPLDSINQSLAQSNNPESVRTPPETGQSNIQKLEPPKPEGPQAHPKTAAGLVEESPKKEKKDTPRTSARNSVTKTQQKFISDFGV